MQTAWVSRMCIRALTGPAHGLFWDEQLGILSSAVSRAVEW